MGVLPYETMCAAVVLKYVMLWFSLLTDKKPVDIKSATLFTRRPVKEDISVRRQQSMERLCVLSSHLMCVTWRGTITGGRAVLLYQLRIPSVDQLLKDH